MPSSIGTSKAVPMSVKINVLRFSSWGRHMALAPWLLLFLFGLLTILATRYFRGGAPIGIFELPISYLPIALVAVGRIWSADRFAWMTPLHYILIGVWLVFIWWWATNRPFGISLRNVSRNSGREKGKHRRH